MLFFVCNLNQSTFFCLFLVPLVSRSSPARLSVTGAILTLRDNLNNSTFRIGLLYPCYTLANCFVLAILVLYLDIQKNVNFCPLHLSF